MDRVRIFSIEQEDMKIGTYETLEETEITNPKCVRGGRYSLKPGLGAWQLTFAEYHAVIKDQMGLHYLSYLFNHPQDLPIHGLELHMRACPKAPCDVR
jgi:hypothetical protein